MSSVAIRRQEGIVPHGGNSGLTLVKRVARDINGVPELAELTAEQISKVAEFVILERYKEDLRKTADRERIDYPADVELFIAGRKSERTKALYRGALTRLETWCKRNGITPLDVDPALADRWIESMKASGIAASSVNLNVSAVSSFFSLMERWHKGLMNPIRGTRARPQRKPFRTLAVPTEEEVRTIMDAAKPPLRAAVAVMSGLGLRIGGLPSFSVNGARWSAHSKGKDHAGKVTEEVREEITRAGLSLRSPFGSAVKISKAFSYLAEKLKKEGRISAAFSPHDLRHAFAVKAYTESKDIYRVSKLLGHSGISVTELYLRSLKVME